MLPLTLTTEQKQHLKLVPKTAAGNDAKLDGAPVWTVISGAGTVVPDADGLGAFVLSSDTVDNIDTIFELTADADLGTGVIPITDRIVLTTVHANAANLGLVAEPPVAK